MKTIDNEQKDGLATAINLFLCHHCGDNWEEKKRKDKKAFPYPVLANIYHDLVDGKSFRQRKLANEIMKKIHVSEPEEVKALLDSFLDERTQAIYWKEAKKSLEPNQKTKGLDQLLFMVA